MRQHSIVYMAMLLACFVAMLPSGVGTIINSMHVDLSKL